MWVIEIPGNTPSGWTIVRRNLSEDEAENLRVVNIADGQTQDVDFRIREVV